MTQYLDRSARASAVDPSGSTALAQPLSARDCFTQSCAQVSAAGPGSGSGSDSGSGSTSSLLIPLVAGIVGGVAVIALVVLMVVWRKRVSARRLASREHEARMRAALPQPGQV